MNAGWNRKKHVEGAIKVAERSVLNKRPRNERNYWMIAFRIINPFRCIIFRK